MDTFSRSVLDLILSIINISIGVIVGLLILVRCLAFVFREYQNKLLYLPSHPDNSRCEVEDPARYGIPRELVSITVDNSGQGRDVAPTTVTGFILLQSEPLLSATVVYFHGNAGNVGHRIPIAHKLYTLGFNVFMPDYRGYGLSTGSPSEEGLQADAAACIEWLLARDDIDVSSIFIFGTSLGGAVTIWLAAHHEPTRLAIAGLILENTFTSISDMVDCLAEPLLGLLDRAEGEEHHRSSGGSEGGMTRVASLGSMERGSPPAPAGANRSSTDASSGRSSSMLRGVLRLLKPVALMVHWPSSRHMHRVTVPCLFLSSAQDELVPPSQMKALHQCLMQKPKVFAVKKHSRFVSLERGTHNDAFLQPTWPDEIESFVRAVVSDRVRGHAS